MRKSLWKVVALAVVLALGVVAMSAVAADVQEKAAPCAMSGAKAAPAELKGCGMHGAPAAEMKGCATMSGGPGEMKCGGKGCCGKHAGAKSGCAMGAKGGCAMGAEGGKGCGMHAGAMAGCGMGAKGGPGCGMHAGAMPGCGMGPGGGMGMGMACTPEKMKELGLTPEQQRKMADAHERMQRQGIQLEADLRIARLDMEKLMRAEQPDRAAIEAQVDRISGIEAALQKARIATQLEARSILTPEQLRKLHEGPASCGAKDEAPARPVKTIVKTTVKTGR